jgi:plasmid stabilization system protein ParE
VTYRVRLTAEVLEDLERLYESLLERNLDVAERALDVIEHGFSLLAYSPFSCRKASLQNNPRWRELLIEVSARLFDTPLQIGDEQPIIK